MNDIKRIFVEKKSEFAVDAEQLFYDLKENLGIKGLAGVRLLNRYDIAGISEADYQKVRTTILSEPPVDFVFDEKIEIEDGNRVFAIEYLPGQYDQRADSATQCIQLITLQDKPLISAAKVIILKGGLTDEEFLKIKKYLINPVDSKEASLEKQEKFRLELDLPDDVETLHGFTGKSESELERLFESLALAMSAGDFFFCRDYFREEEKRDPTITEIKMLDTYWSDHCRHTTFETLLQNIEIEKSPFTAPIKKAYRQYLQSYDFVYEDGGSRGVCLMKIATMSMKELRKKNMLNDLEISGEINACSIIRDVFIDGKKEEWLVMFKNETHNHPTEIEPFGGAATCLGGAIRDPLSGRSYVYQAMRVTGSGDPRKKIEDTLPGKLPQRKITTEAAHGYSSYGNQIGVPTGQVVEIYHEGYVAKRMEVGAVIAAVPKENVVRQEPVPGDLILLIGGKTGRDGIGGATGSSKEHTEKSIFTAGAEVQKGNPPEERKLQRLLRNPAATRLIKKSNDFGAGGVSVAIGELAEGLVINLDQVPKKYEGLDGTELALSESQERMAVVVSAKDADRFKELADEENLEASEIARVTADNRLKMYWRGKKIIDISRNFINSNGVRQKNDVFVSAPSTAENYFKKTKGLETKSIDLKKAWLENLQDLNVGSQKGLVERFDSTVGAGTVFLPFGGKYQRTPIEAMVAKIPLPSKREDTITGTVMSFGFNPEISTWSPFHGAVYAVVEAAAKIVATGGEYSSIRTTLQEYFEKLGKDKKKWGKPFSALIGAYYALSELGIPAIGGKDSMSGSFENLNVPPTLITFAVDTIDVNHAISPEFKQAGSPVFYMKLNRDEQEMPDFTGLKKNFSIITENIKAGKIISAASVKAGGLAEVISKMSFGNRLGFIFTKKLTSAELFSPDYGSMILEVDCDIESVFKNPDFILLGYTREEPVIKIEDVIIQVEEAFTCWRQPLESIFPTETAAGQAAVSESPHTERSGKRPVYKFARPRVVIPVFPGTNCEYETGKAFEKAGAEVDTHVFRNLTTAHIDDSLKKLREKIDNAQIIAIPGGFSAGDEPDGSGKFIAAVFRNPTISEAVMKLLNDRDGLMLGICNGFQALIKLGLVPYGDIRDMQEGCPTLTFNRIGRHVSCMVRTRVTSVLSPWFLLSEAKDIHTIPVSHGEGRFVAAESLIMELFAKGQVAAQYVDADGQPTQDIAFNPNGSFFAVEGITSPDGRVLGKMGHSERKGANVSKNVPGQKDQQLFESGVKYFE
jgi:phosphoribosylformylglycinamidine synthase